MDAADLHAAISAERLRLADVIDALTPEQWTQPTLCAGWTVKTLVAHLTLTSRLTPFEAVRAMIAARFDINRMIDRSARARAAEYSPAELAAQYRESATWTGRPFGTKPRDPLVDVLVHGQDLTRPLSIRLPMPAEHVVPALDHTLGASFYGAPKRLAGLRLVATDADWSHGEGADEVRGPSGDLLLVATGRRSGLDALEGPGVETVSGRL
ncbi:maleylpyruvate isomerase family mycothiol-dependent enzyme [Actinomycetospora straminea]|uniref:Maleylpyruvate isomerase family mycothiol-dependent enzyme n=1 Tax=Actinomycetospora straminea TaxID=663607 RepID=A0ABP9E2N9_9PSEU|nr:maleylpyruvate isomerase family mycothiol-dependent enzyme [Actinomycetospora straminea]MDD7931366.1 maleylpyruvate isomerase family mycothiol-dependent enzyme [Actinomycetospora straminea]